MSALISFLAGESHVMNNLAGSGLGFFGSSGYGTSVQVGAYQDTTYITDATGTASNAVITNNVKWTDPGSGQIDGVNYSLRSIANYLATLQIQFTNDTPVQTQNPQLRIFDRSNIDNPAVGVVTKVAVLIHPWDNPSPAGSGDIFWQSPGGSGSIVDLTQYPASVSPGSGGFSPSGSNTVDTVHSWYFAISAMPTSVGSKTSYGLSFQVEFL